MWEISLIIKITFDEIFKVTPFFIPNFNLLSCKLDSFTFKVLFWIILFWYYTKTKQVYNTLIVPGEKSTMVPFTSSVMKKIFVTPGQSRFPVKLACCFAFGSTSSVCYLLKSISIIL